MAELKIATLRLVATPDLAHRFETVARLRFRTLYRACFSSQLACADHLKVGLRSVSRWSRGSARIPGWVLMALEDVARERNVTIAGAVRRAA